MTSLDSTAGLDLLDGPPVTGWKRIALTRQGRVSRPKLLAGVALGDFVMLLVTGLLAAHLSGAAATASLLPWREALMAGVLVGVLNHSWCYSISALRSRSGQMVKVVSALVPAFLGLAGLFYITGLKVWPAGQLAIWLALAVGLAAVSRFATAALVQRLAQAGLLQRRTVIAGGGREAQELIAALAKDEGDHLEILGVFDDRQADRLADFPATIAKLGTFEELTEFCSRAGVDLVIVTVPPRAEERLLDVLQKLFHLEVDIRVSAHNSKLPLTSSAYRYIGSIPMLAIMDKPLRDLDIVVKSIADRVLAGLILLLAAPVMVLVAIAVRLDSRGPILFRQNRYGFNNELIAVYKFRSMYTEMSDANAAKLVTRGDPRVTRVGRFIRKTSLDELPQLFNVLTGQMALVGPRPHATQAKAGSDLYEDVVKRYFARHRMKPGVTGWAQINGWRGETDTAEKIQRRVEYDLHYIDNWSLLLDLYIVVVTPFALLSGKNAY